MGLESKIKIFESGKDCGIFSRHKKFYPPKTTKKVRTKLFNEVKDRIGKKYGFDGKKIFQAYQKAENNNIQYEDGKYIVIKDKYMRSGDYWYKTLYADILIISDKYPNVVVGNQMADCPIIIVEDRKKGVTALSHCGTSYIDRYLPKQTVESLIKEYNSNVDDLYVYVGSCAKKENYIYDKYPDWATHKDVWDGFIIKEGKDYHIDMNGAIRKQLEDIGIKHIEESKIDTMSDDRYYSHRESAKGNKDKHGQNFVGFYYK